MKTCVGCGQAKPAERLRENRSLCRPCEAQRVPWAAAEYRAWYKARKANQIPSWADRDKIREIYKAAYEQGLHVDHLVPLQSFYVTGFHTQENLQLLSEEKNRRKGNAYWEDMSIPTDLW